MDEETCKEIMRTALLITLADKQVTAQEKAALRPVQKELGLDDEELRALVKQVQADAEVRTEAIPLRREEARIALESMIALCAADGNVTMEEVEILQRLAGRFGVAGTEWQAILEAGMTQAQSRREEKAAADPAAQRRQQEAEELIEEFYAHFHEWPDAAQRAQRLVELGRDALVPLVRAFESYRVPDRCESARAFKTILADCLAQVGDSRAVFYLASFIDMGAGLEEVGMTELRQAAAEAVGKIVHLEFPRSDDGVAQVRAWWRDIGHRTYKTLAY